MLMKRLRLRGRLRLRLQETSIQALNEPSEFRPIGVGRGFASLLNLMECMKRPPFNGAVGKYSIVGVLVKILQFQPSST
jgi:hypothetical protein